MATSHCHYDGGDGLIPYGWHSWGYGCTHSYHVCLCFAGTDIQLVTFTLSLWSFLSDYFLLPVFRNIVCCTHGHELMMNLSSCLRLSLTLLDHLTTFTSNKIGCTCPLRESFVWSRLKFSLLTPFLPSPCCCLFCWFLDSSPFTCCSLHGAYPSGLQSFFHIYHQLWVDSTHLHSHLFLPADLWTS